MGKEDIYMHYYKKHLFRNYFKKHYFLMVRDDGGASPEARPYAGQHGILSNLLPDPNTGEITLCVDFDGPGSETCFKRTDLITLDRHGAPRGMPESPPAP